MAAPIDEAYRWYLATKPKGLAHPVCEQRDVFQARVDSLGPVLRKRGAAVGSVGMISAIVGEIGNNCFDHNLGRWADSVGAYFDYGFKNGHLWAVVADRGAGVLATLKRVAPDLRSDQQALDKAFHERISGRAPERRGNGLKFVREGVSGAIDAGLFFQSGKGIALFGNRSADALSLLKVDQGSVRKGTFALLLWGAK